MADIDWKALGGYFDTDEIEWRIQQAGERNGRVWAIAVPYVTARAIQQRLDDVLGPGSWRNEYAAGPAGGILCGISVKVDGEWVTKWDGAENTDIEEVKGGISGAFKRAAVLWNIGRYLYRLDESFAQVSENGKLRGKTKDGKPFRWDPPQLPAWALPKKEKAAGRKHAPERSTRHEAMLVYLGDAGLRVPKDHACTVDGMECTLRPTLTRRWEAIKESEETAAAFVEAVAAVTKIPFQPGEG